MAGHDTLTKTIITIIERSRHKEKLKEEEEKGKGDKWFILRLAPSCSSAKVDT